MDIPSLEKLIKWGTALVTGSSAVRAGLIWLEGGIAIWIPMTDTSRFWQTYEKVLASLAFLSISPKRIGDAPAKDEPPTL